MLQSMRDNMKGTIAFIIVGFLGLIMALSLVSFDNVDSTRIFDEVATVEGEGITERDLQIAIAQRKQGLQAQFGDSLPAEFLSDERLRQPVLQDLVRRKVLLHKANDGGLAVSDAELDALVIEMPQFRTDGVFDPQLFTSAIRRLGYTQTSYRNLLRDDVVINQLRNALTTTAFITEPELEAFISLSQQTRDFSWIALPLGDLIEEVAVSQDEIQSYYDLNRESYLTEEQVAVEYIDLKVSEIADSTSASDEVVKAQYQEELKEFSSNLEREAAHILIEGDSEEAQAKVAIVQAKLAEREDFATLAEQYSEDFGSREVGGLLGLSGGDVFPEAFEEVLAKLEVGQVSEPTTIDGATHFIKLVSVKIEEPPTFEESQGRIKRQLKIAQAEEVYLERLSSLRELSYNAEQLAEVAKALGLNVSKTGLFTRSEGPGSVLADARVMEAAFSEQVLQQGFTSDVLELTSGRAVVLNLVQHEPAYILSLEEKTEDISAKLKLEKAKALLAEQAQSLKQALVKGKNISELAEENGFTLKTEIDVNRNGNIQPSEVLEHVFSLPRPSEQPVTSSLYLSSSNDYVLLSLAAVKDAVYNELSAEEKRNSRLSLAQITAISEFRAWQSDMVDGSEVAFP
jgi:peptidyl-prolyl cis-trans isomerase D